MSDKLIVALDLPTPEDASRLVATLGDTVSFYKIGLELAYGGGLPLAERLIGEGKKVFLDLKLHDIPATVERAAKQVARLGATFLTVHAFPQTMRAAKAGVGDDGPGVLGVTVMTSYDDADLESAGYSIGVRDLVARRADQAVEAGIDGLILSAEEVAAMRRRVGAKLKLVTPGIRPAGAAAGDQKRVMTPAAALAAGADHLVIGRPITRADDPRGAAAAILAEMAAGQAV
ncbi:Orotidine 5'-phosphate decarboxylase [Beijerinckiaceae bacterium RH AL1]|nr:orotidine-5'-phosphate decarboxylase [Beijerinckiaceae bacterium]VVB42377.1 Orotidine 5'-phosphate decarboxylase [Beijerinckiaceae bacterium RH AL8]VVB42378.1 Orotidine 5'-phosphate decarboxylase [Beijerinckiaceae bacterium RH CH11]VVC53278.1 Orotidine 5'-phosphate decarboxylase [Beijerinckiaceae bacterium RH AL1]